MRSITTKLICTLVIMALLAGGVYWVSTILWNVGNTGTSSTPSGTISIPTTPTTSHHTAPPHPRIG